jgi:pyruvate/2-oxoglutarate/acetoin dehydrogenase E1 component/TPP-dependent pyruvate/acetoin dehydrogenase alpha subunit
MRLASKFCPSNNYICYMERTTAAAAPTEILSFDRFRNEVLKDYRTAMLSRQVSLMGRREVLTGKAKFGIFGDGKELPQVALAKFFQPGDWRSGYYRDQTWMFALGLATVEQFFAQLYADPYVENDPWSAGRQMNAHFTSKNVDEAGNWIALSEQYNTATDMAPTAAQVPRALGLAYASKVFRQLPMLQEATHLSRQGHEVCFCSIGDASTSEGHFWETMNAACVLQVPLAMFVWDDGYGISVPKEKQTTKGSISEALKGFEATAGANGMKIYKVKAWDYAGMCEVFEQGLAHIRATHMPALFHVEEVTQPQGHSTSGSHERYKTAERLEWERDWDCIKKFREWILSNELATEEELDELDNEIRAHIKISKDNAWAAYLKPIQQQVDAVAPLLQSVVASGADEQGLVAEISNTLLQKKDPLRRDVLKALATGIDFAHGRVLDQMLQMQQELNEINSRLYHSHLYNEGSASALKVPAVAAQYSETSVTLNGYEVLNRYFDALFSHNPLVLAFGEDLGQIGDVNQGFAGLQQKHGEGRIFDTGIREASIMGQGIGLALRGLRPIAEIQYLDYLLYGLQPLSDDVASLHYRTFGQQSCPLIVRTRGHRLEGIWHSGSPMGMIINSLRGMYVCVPRNMVQAVGMYNTLLKSNDPALVIEALNGYRLKEQLPENLLEFTVPLGVPEVLREGTDITIVSYGSTLRIVQEAAVRLQQLGIDAEVVDVQTLLPFDKHHAILASLKKTSRILFVDEDVPGGAAGFMFNQVMEQQGGYRWLDTSPRTLTAQAHRPAYGSDGDYFSKPNMEDVVRVVKEMMAE